MVKGSHKVVVECLELMLRPIIRFCIRRSIKLQDFLQISKTIFVRVAEAEMEQSEVKVSASRLSLMTGVHRKDVAQILSEGPLFKNEKNFITRIIGQWQNDPRFSTKSGKPRTLTCQGKNNEFIDLVRSVSNDPNPYTVLYELERLGMVQKTSRGLKLIGTFFNPSMNPTESLKLLASDTDDLITAVEENIEGTEKVPNLHIKTEYDKVSEDAVEKIRNWFIKEGGVFHARARKFLSQFDKDINPDVKGKNCKVRVAVGTFSRVEAPEAGD